MLSSKLVILHIWINHDSSEPFYWYLKSYIIVNIRYVKLFQTFIFIRSLKYNILIDQSHQGIFLATYR